MQYQDALGTSGKMFLWSFLGLLAIFAVSIGVIVQKGSSEKASLSRKVEEAEKKMEDFFYEGYDKGYQSAIIDAYLQDPNYMVLENENGGATLWKRVEVDQANKERLDAEVDNEERPSNDTTSS
jgi:hypothetical protein